MRPGLASEPEALWIRNDFVDVSSRGPELTPERCLVLVGACALGAAAMSLGLWIHKLWSAR